MAQKTDRNKLTEELDTAQGLPGNIKTEDQLWDAILKKEVFFLPEQLFPLIQEIYGKSYEKHSLIKVLATEYPVDHIKTQKISSIRSDITFQIDSHDIFHFECESKKDKSITMRMFEYDSHIALNYNASPYSLHFPLSALICLYYQKNIPKTLSLHLHFKEDSSYTYQIPVLNIHSYSLADIQNKHLSILIPFLPLRFRKSLQSKKFSQKNFRKELTSFYQEIILILEEEVKNNYLNEYDQKLILQLLRKSLIRVFCKNRQLLKEVLIMTEPVLKLEHEEYFYAMKLQKEEFFKIERELAKKQTELSKTQSELAKNKSELAEKDNEIALLKQQLAALKSN